MICQTQFSFLHDVMQQALILIKCLQTCCFGRYLRGTHDKLNIMTFVQEYTIDFLQGSQLFISFRAKGPSGNKQLKIPEGNKFVYSFTKTHDIVCVLSKLARKYFKLLTEFK